MVDFLAEQKINILLCIGGDGTLRGAQEIAKEVQKRGLNTAVVAIPGRRSCLANRPLLPHVHEKPVVQTQYIRSRLLNNISVRWSCCH